MKAFARAILHLILMLFLGVLIFFMLSALSEMLPGFNL